MQMHCIYIRHFITSKERGKLRQAKDLIYVINASACIPGILHVGRLVFLKLKSKN